MEEFTLEYCSFYFQKMNRYFQKQIDREKNFDKYYFE